MTEIRDIDKLYAARLDDMPRRFRGLARREGMIAIDDRWRINLVKHDDAAVRGCASLAAFLEKYCGLRIPVVTGESPCLREMRLDWDDYGGQGYRIDVREDLVTVTGDGPAGVLYGAHRIHWMMGDNGGPYLAPGEVVATPRTQVRMTSTPFRQPFDDAGDPLTYTDDYLDLMAHYGFNGLHLYIDLYDYMADVPEAPELVSPSASGRIDRLADLSERAAQYNIGIYLHLNAARRSKNHPVFKAHPELVGAACWSEEWRCLCGSEPKVARIYSGAINGIVDKVPGVKGVVALVGGECLLHCYTRPWSCPDLTDR